MNRELRLEILKRYDTQAKFAATIGVRECVVSRVIRGHRRLDDNQIVAWASALGFDPEDFARSFFSNDCQQ